MALSATANGRGLVSQTWHLLNISGNGNAMAINSFSGPAVRGKPCQKLSNGAGNRILNLMPSMTTFRKSSNSMDTTAGRFPVITISTTGCCFRKTQRHRTRNGAMPFNYPMIYDIRVYCLNYLLSTSAFSNRLKICLILFCAIWQSSSISFCILIQSKFSSNK